MRKMRKVLVALSAVTIFGCTAFGAQDVLADTSYDMDNDGYLEYEESYDDYEDDWYAFISSGALGASSVNVGSSVTGSVVIDTNIHDSWNIDVVWVSSDPGVASISGSGSVVTINGLKAGNVTISAQLTYYGSILDSETYGLTVNQASPIYVNVQGISIDRTSLNMSLNDTCNLNAKVVPENANNKEVYWCSSNPDVATVSDSGYVRPISCGTTTITVRTKENGYPAYCQVCVGGGNGKGGVPVAGVSLNMTGVNLGIGQMMVMTPTIYPSNASIKDVLWTTTDLHVATVGANGVITAVGAGSCTVTCTTLDGAKSASATVNVGNNVAPSLNTGFVVTTSVVDPQLNYDAMVKLAAAKPNGVAKVSANRPMSYDINVANAMLVRPDVKLQCVFPFNGHSFRLTLPAGYNLAANLNKAGYVEWLDLCKLNGKLGVVLEMLN